MNPCVSAFHIAPPAAEFRWWDHDGKSHDLCASCTGWWLVGALCDEGMTPRGIDVAPAEWCAFDGPGSEEEAA